MQELELPLIEVIQETPSIKSFKFSLQGRKLSFNPGQYMIMDLKVADPKGNTRLFSISSAPLENFLMFSTKISDSNFKQKLNSLKIGEKVKLQGPLGRFTLQEDIFKKTVMIAGGIGITPFRSMIKFALNSVPGLKIVLLYSNKTPDEIAFKKEFEELASTHAENFSLVNTITQPEEALEWIGRIGRIDETLIKEFVEDLNEAIFYVCGPPKMVEAMVSLLKEMQIPSTNIKFEKFVGY